MAIRLNPFHLFSRKRTIKNLCVEDLHKERITLDNEERRLEKEMGRLRHDDRQLLSEYAAAGNAGDSHQKKILARKLQDVRGQLTALDQRHGFLTKQMRIISGLRLIKENEAFLNRLGANSRINAMDLVELQQYVEQATTDGELTNEKLEQLLTTMNDANDVWMASEQDTGLGSFMAALDGELEHRGIAIAAKGQPGSGGLDSAIDAIDRELARAGAVNRPRGTEQEG